MNQINIWDLNGQEIDLSNYGLIGQRLIVPSPSYEVTRETAPGRAGTIPLGKDLSARNLEALFMVYPADYDDYFLLRDELYALFSKGNSFYIGEKRQPGKRWFVECTEQWVPDRITPVPFMATIPLSAESGMAESVGTTLDPFTFDVDLWQIGQGLIIDDLNYVHNSAVFNIFNAGSLPINPRNMDLVIEYKGASNNLKIKNETSGEEWTHTGTSNSGDTILLNGIRSTKNGLSIYRNTNKKIITLAPGWNGFKLSGTSGTFEIKFKFRFYYL